MRRTGTAPLDSVSLVGYRDLPGIAFLVALFMVVFGSVFTFVPLAMVTVFPAAQNPRAAPPLLVILIFVVVGLAILIGGLHTLLAPRRVLLHRLTGEVEEIGGFFGIQRARHRLSDFGHLRLSSERSSRGQVSYSVALHGPGNSRLMLREHMTDRNEAVMLGARAVRATGLPFDQLDENGGRRRLTLADLERIPPPAASRPWWQMPSALALLLANLLPLAGVLLYDWPVLPLMLLFWLENLVVGAYNIARMMLAQNGTVEVSPLARLAGNLFFCIFFLIHYGAFSTGHGSFLLAMFDQGKSVHDTGASPIALILLASDVVTRYGMGWSLLALVISHGISFWLHYLRPRAYREAIAGQLMMAPYRRVIVLHVVIILCGFASIFSQTGFVSLVILVVIKAGVDLWAHLKEHRDGGGEQLQAVNSLMPGLPQAPPPAAAAASIVKATTAASSLAAGQDLNDQPLSHYMGGWQLAPGELHKAGWLARASLREEGGRIRIRLEDHETGIVREGLEKIEFKGNAARVEFIEVRIKNATVQRILRFTASGTHRDRLDLNEVRHSVGDARDMQARSVALVRERG